jgi:hypothetical protein
VAVTAELPKPAAAIGAPVVAGTAAVAEVVALVSAQGSKAAMKAAASASVAAASTSISGASARGRKPKLSKSISARVANPGRYLFSLLQL